MVSELLTNKIGKIYLLSVFFFVEARLGQLTDYIYKKN